MNKNYVTYFSKYFREYHASTRETEKYLNGLFDKIIVWVISLSTGALLLLISSFDKVKFADKPSLTLIVALLTISILSGILGRVSFAISIYLSNELADQSQSAMMALEAAYQPYTLTGKETAEEIVELLKISFDIDADSIKQKIKEVTKPKEIIEYNKRVRKYYEEMKLYVKEEQQRSLKIVTSEMNKYLGIEPKNELGNPKRKRKLANGLLDISYFLFSITVISFITTVIFSVCKITY